MIECYKTTAEGTQRIDVPEKGCWVSAVAPTSDERAWLMNELGIIPEFIRSALDDEETSHTDFDDDTHQALIILDCPFVEDGREAEDTSITQYDTHPLSFLFLPEQDMIVTVSLKENVTVSAFSSGMRHINTNQRSRLLLQMILHVAHRYVTYLRNIERQYSAIERVMRETMQNNELIKMLGFEKSLVYFSTSLKSMESMLARIKGGRVIKLYEDDRDLLDDIFIEINQAIEMCTIYTRVLSSTMDTFGSVMSNNLNITMRRLTIITLVLAVPTIVFSFYGMNVSGLPLDGSWIPACIMAGIICLIVSLVLVKSRMLR